MLVMLLFDLMSYMYVGDGSSDRGKTNDRDRHVQRYNKILNYSLFGRYADKPPRQ